MVKQTVKTNEVTELVVIDGKGYYEELVVVINDYVNQHTIATCDCQTCLELRGKNLIRQTLIKIANND